MSGLTTPGDTIGELYRVLQDRRTADPGASYVASLYRKGPDAILKKVGEEAAETLIAAKNPDDEALVRELADLWFHTLVLMASRDIEPQRVTGELARRFGTSGHAEKAARPQTS
ncbi:phosphoribosyl-ATP diphosphatase [Sinimarinibacterium flocculans]|uniref:Phosphoribosyl-ATP pyrophosphatase n=1 Tax=Sinimarinibacterium flocculans TaxID=985250 RepID=A0A318E6X7_9GAMM|nr:phosphoribosyl-ATP diphosphatase [Sinimarinibacterium flocculans]MEC9363659.1 phosphoribosyl-ATP diphosphatase [Pseudomonadota bacterium]PXV64905.1 phosphoribosyl-ATP pyrophosphatase [Sinimarinibacterium flocculans]